MVHYAAPARGILGFTAPEGRGDRTRVGVSEASGGPEGGHHGPRGAVKPSIPRVGVV
jgi:hypothetical protein